MRTKVEMMRTYDPILCGASSKVQGLVTARSNPSDSYHRLMNNNNMTNAAQTYEETGL
jgi:hypothetical protein